MKNRFDIAMDYIDVNIKKNNDIIKKGLLNEIGYNSHVFGNCFTILTNQTLFHYINMRRLFFASQEILQYPEKTICDIAIEYGYSEQSAFTRAMKVFWDCTPNEIKRNTKVIPDNKHTLENIVQKHKNTKETRTQKILHDLETKGTLSLLNGQLFIDLEKAAEDLEFDIDTCYEIADLAEKLQISPAKLLYSCHSLILEQELESEQYGYISEKEQLEIIFDLSEEENIDDICDFFNCKYYDIDKSMVDNFRTVRYKGE